MISFYCLRIMYNFYGTFNDVEYNEITMTLLDCIRFAKIRNDSGDPSYSTMKKTPRVRHAFHSRKS